MKKTWICLAIVAMAGGRYSFVRGQNYFAELGQALALHETWTWVGTENGKDVVRLYNQFNPINYTNRQGDIIVHAGTPNMSSDGLGWGVGQIGGIHFADGKVPTAVVWNFEVNVNEMIRIVVEKLGNHETFIVRQRRYCLQNDIPWVEPPTLYTTNGVTFPAAMWAAMVLYNGVAGIPFSPGLRTNGTLISSQSPWAYTNGAWILYDNRTNYIRKVTDHVNQVKTNGVTVRE